MKDILVREGAFAIMGYAIEVHWTPGSGFLEGVYADAFSVELKERESLSNGSADFRYCIRESNSIGVV
jgi:hypothetical protein